MAILLWIFIGLVFGSAARWVMPGPRTGGKPVAIALAIAGAALGGQVGAWWTESVTGIDLPTTLTAIAGSLLVSFSFRSYALRAMESQVIGQANGEKQVQLRSGNVLLISNPAWTSKLHGENQRSRSVR